MSSSFRSILQQVTLEKLEELKLQKNLMSSHFLPVLSSLEKSPGKAGLSLLYSAVKGSPVQDSIDPVLLDNLKYVLANSGQDPSISGQLVDAWIARVQGEIQYSLRKCEYSYLYGSLLSEWLDLEEKRRKEGTDPGTETKNKDIDATTAAAREKTLTILKTLHFKAPTPEEFSPEKFRNFLSQELFSFGDNVAGEAVLHQVIKETGDFFIPENYYISTHDVQCCIKGLCSEELLSPEKKAALKELSDNPEALEEVASLLTNRLKNLDRWEWPSNIGDEVTEIRRGLAGNYEPFLNEDIITALFLQYVGVEWGAYFKRQFFAIYDSKGWSRKDAKVDSVEGYRGQFYRNALLSALPDSVQSQENRNKDEYARVESEEIMMDSMEYNSMPAMRMLAAAPQAMMPGQASFGGAARSHKMKRSAPPPPMPKPEIDFKQQFLHVLTTEIKLNATLRPDQPLIVVQADLESFGPSIIHEAALIALEYLGVKKEWLTFFQKFLQPKVRFAGGDKAQQVLRGVPSAHALSKLFGETLLFLQDFLVNRKCNGMRLYRISDELWFWGHESKDVVSAWETLHSYGAMVGLKVNAARSGSASVFSEGQFLKAFPGVGKNEVKIVPGPSPLPQKNIHWGYLQLTSSGIFSIDSKAVAKFLDEMKGLLDKSECVLEWINIFNKYFTFFIRNFGKSAVASGKQHLDQIVSALNQIYSGLLAGAPDPVTLLRGRFPSLGSSCSAGDIVDAWVYWPLERGGLGLVNPFIAVMALRETFAESEKGSPLDLDFSKLPPEDRQTWEDMKKDWEKMYGPVPDNNEPPMQMSMMSRQVQGPYPVQPTPPHRQKLPTWEEYVASRETELRNWYSRYIHLLERPGPKYPSVSDPYHSLEWRGQDEEGDRNYFMWLYSYYETQLRGHFGSVTFINVKLLPMSMIANIQKAKVLHN